MKYFLKITMAFVLSVCCTTKLQAQLLHVEQVSDKFRDSLYSARCTQVLVLKKQCTQRFCNAPFTLDTKPPFVTHAYIFWKSAGKGFVSKIDQLKIYRPVSFPGLLLDQLTDFYRFHQNEIDSGQFLHAYAVPREVQELVYDSTIQLSRVKNITIYEQEYYKYNSDYKLDKISYSDAVTLEYGGLNKQFRNFLYMPLASKNQFSPARTGNDISSYYVNQDLELVQWLQMIESDLFWLEATHVWEQREISAAQKTKKRSSKRAPEGWLPVKFDVEKESRAFIDQLIASGADTILYLAKRNEQEAHPAFAPFENANPAYVFYVHHGNYHVKKFDRFKKYNDEKRASFQHLQLYDFYSRNQEKLDAENENAESTVNVKQSPDAFPELTVLEMRLGNVDFKNKNMLSKNSPFVNPADGNYSLFKTDQWIRLIESELFELEQNVW